MNAHRRTPKPWEDWSALGDTPDDPDCLCANCCHARKLEFPSIRAWLEAWGPRAPRTTPEGWHYPNRETFVLRHGQAFDPVPLSMEQQAYARACVERAGVKPTMGQCYVNSRQTMERGDVEQRLAYVEGFCGKGTHHGWLLLDGLVLDLTLRSLQVGLALHVPKALKWLGAPDRAERVYFGVPMAREGVPAEIWRSAFGLIEWAEDYQPTTLRDEWRAAVDPDGQA